MARPVEAPRPSSSRSAGRQSASSRSSNACTGPAAAPAAPSSRSVAESGVVSSRSSGGRGSGSPAAAATAAAPARRSSPSGVRPGPRPRRPWAARRSAASSPQRRAASSAATAARDGLRAVATSWGRRIGSPASPSAASATPSARQLRSAAGRERRPRVHGREERDPDDGWPRAEHDRVGQPRRPGPAHEGDEALAEDERPGAGSDPLRAGRSRAWTGAAIAATLTGGPRPARPARLGRARAADGRCRRRSGPRPRSRAGRPW